MSKHIRSIENRNCWFFDAVLTCAAMVSLVTAVEAKPPKVSWSQEHVTIEVASGGSNAQTVALTADETLKDVAIDPVPALDRFLTVHPSSIGTLPAGRSQEVTLSAMVPADTPATQFAGTVHLRSGPRTLPATLKVTIDVVPGPDPDEVDRASAGILTLEGASETDFNPLDAELGFRLEGATFVSDTSAFSIYHQGRLIPASEIHITDQLVTVDPQLQVGRNEFVFIGTDTDQALITREFVLWAGNRTLDGVTVDNRSQAVGDSEILVQLGDDPSVQTTERANASGEFRLRNLPPRTIFLDASAPGQFQGTIAVNGADGFATITMFDFNAASDIDNNDFSQGLDGWDIGTAPVALIPHDEETSASTATAQAPTPLAERDAHAADFDADAILPQSTVQSDGNQDLLLATSGEGPQHISRTFNLEPGTKSVTVRHRFITTEVPGGFFGTQFNDYFNVTIRTQQGGGTTSESNSMNGLGLAAFDANGFTAWRETSLPVAEEGDTLQVDLTVANVADGLFDSFLVVDFVEEQRFAISELALNDIDSGSLNFLSTDAHTYFQGNTRIHGTVTVEGPSDEALDELVLEIVQGGGVVAKADLAAAAEGALLQSFGEDEQVQINSTQLLFDLPSSEASNVDISSDGTLTLRARAKSSSGETDSQQAGSVELLADYDGTNRYGERDEAVGGDDWAQPSLLSIVEEFDGTLWGDFSNMNAGPFPPHSSHQSGNDADGWFDGYNARDTGTAQTLIDFLNTSAGANVSTILVTFEQVDGDPFWNAIRDVVLDDGRPAREVIRPYPGHTTHFHLRN